MSNVLRNVDENYILKELHEIYKKNIQYFFL